MDRTHLENIETRNPIQIIYIKFRDPRWEKIKRVKTHEYLKVLQAIFCAVVGLQYLKKRSDLLLCQELKPWENSKLYEKRIQDIYSAYTVVEPLFECEDVR